MSIPRVTAFGFVVLLGMAGLNTAEGTEALSGAPRQFEEQKLPHGAVYNPARPERAYPAQGNDVSPDRFERHEDKLMNKEEHICNGC